MLHGPQVPVCNIKLHCTWEKVHFLASWEWSGKEIGNPPTFSLATLFYAFFSLLVTEVFKTVELWIVLWSEICGEIEITKSSSCDGSQLSRSTPSSWWSPWYFSLHLSPYTPSVLLTPITGLNCAKHSSCWPMGVQRLFCSAIPTFPYCPIQSIVANTKPLVEA